jgi:Tol biopolymer transport system component
MTLAPGDRLGPYVITAPIDAGGMGEVYRARDPRLNRDVAIKIMRGGTFADAEARARFVDEAHALSALSHPNIVTIFDIGSDGDVVYLVMELVDGQTLDRLIPSSGMRLGEVLRLGAQIADACAKAHAAGVVHRDLKPANVMVQSDGRVRVLDFGIAKLMTAGAGDTMAADATGTSPGVVLGTAAYMSPEQAEGRPVDARSDIFSLGAMLYEMSSGQRPFKGDSPVTVMAAVLQQEPVPLGEARAGVPPELARVVARCLRKDPARRVQSMADLKVALDELREDAESGRLTAVTPGAARHRRGGRVIVALGVLVIAALGAAGYFAWRAARPAESTETPQPVPLTTYAGSESDPSFSPDGTQLAFRWSGEHQDNPDVYVMLIGGGGTPLRLTTDPRPDFGPRWSPDGRSIAFFRVRERDHIELLLVPPLGGPERTLGEFFAMLSLGGGPTAELCWTPDSRYLLLTGAQRSGEANHVLRVAVDSGEVVSLATSSARLGFTSLALSPDGRTLALGHFEGKPGLELLTLTEGFDARERRPFPRDLGNIADAVWAPDGRSLLINRYVNVPLPFFRASMDGHDLVPLPWVGPGAVGRPAFHGTRMVFARAWRDTNILRLDLKAPGGGAGAVDRIAQSSFRDVSPQYSPDGRRLAFYSNRSGSVQVWTANADGSQPVQLTFMDPLATTGTPRWSPDGREISFDSNVGGTYHLYVVGSGGGKPRQLTSGNKGDFASTWSLDGRFIYFGSNRSGRDEVWRVPSSGGTPEQITTTGGAAPALSADGRWLYFDRSDGVDGLWRMPLSGGAPERLIDHIFRYNYQLTGSGIYYVVPAPDAGLYYRDLASGTTTKLVAIDKPVDLGLAVSPDGRYVLFTQVDYSGQDLMLAENVR